MFNPKDYEFDPKLRFHLKFTEFRLDNAGPDQLVEELNGFSNSVGSVFRSKMSELLDSAVKAFNIDYDPETGKPIKGKLSTTLFDRMEELMRLIEKVSGSICHDVDLLDITKRIKEVIRVEHDKTINIKEYTKDDDWRLDMKDKFADIQDAFLRSASTKRSVEFYDDDEED